ncbi:MAG: LON peptidase substrate-binding domain-containing protein [Chitinophagaceae bacterium]|nr:LON peptidase substrate-binding domain-containing protein [Chitinophagaceae bacterium]
MTNFIPIFPLGIVVYPGEHLNLHIFEPRYKQMITECSEAGRPFGIPTVIDNKMGDMGTMAEVVEISTVYQGGEMDVKTKGVKIFRILETVKLVPDKLYGGAIVTYPDTTEDDGQTELMLKVISAVRQLHQLLKVDKDFKKPDQELLSYDLAHHAGLSLEEEYELLGLLHELQRQEYLKRHLGKVIPMLTEMELLKDKIILNGHFKNLSSFDL